jgi:hypothetical protein
MDALDFGASIFVELNYPFHGSWNEDGVYKLFRKLNYPCTLGAHLLRRQMMRTPIWFMPTTPLNNISIRGLLV